MIVELPVEILHDVCLNLDVGDVVNMSACSWNLRRKVCGEENGPPSKAMYVAHLWKCLYLRDSMHWSSLVGGGPIDEESEPVKAAESQQLLKSLAKLSSSLMAGLGNLLSGRSLTRSIDDDDNDDNDDGGGGGGVMVEQPQDNVNGQEQMQQPWRLFYQRQFVANVAPLADESSFESLRSWAPIKRDSNVVPQFLQKLSGKQQFLHGPFRTPIYGRRAKHLMYQLMAPDAAHQPGALALANRVPVTGMFPGTVGVGSALGFQVADKEILCSVNFSLKYGDGGVFGQKMSQSSLEFFLAVDAVVYVFDAADDQPAAAKKELELVLDARWTRPEAPLIVLALIDDDNSHLNDNSNVTDNSGGLDNDPFNESVAHLTPSMVANMLDLASLGETTHSTTSFSTTTTITTTATTTRSTSNHIPRRPWSVHLVRKGSLDGLRRAFHAIANAAAYWNANRK